MEYGRRTPDQLFPGCLNTLIRCPPKNKRTPDDTLHLASRGTRRTLTAQASCSGVRSAVKARHKVPDHAGGKLGLIANRVLSCAAISLNFPEHGVGIFRIGQETIITAVKRIRLIDLYAAFRFEVFGHARVAKAEHGVLNDQKAAGF